MPTTSRCAKVANKHGCWTDDGGAVACEHRHRDVDPRCDGCAAVSDPVGLRREHERLRKVEEAARGIVDGR